MRNPGVYIIQSAKNGRYYVGSTDDVKRRIEDHNAGRIVSTRSGRPWQLKSFVQCESSAQAKSSEYRLKKYKRRDILEKVIGDMIFPWDH